MSLSPEQREARIEAAAVVLFGFSSPTRFETVHGGVRDEFLKRAAAVLDAADRARRAGMSDSPTIGEIGRVRQGREYITVSTRANEDSVWVQMRRHHGLPWQMTPEIARDLAGLLNIAALTSEAYLSEAERPGGQA